ncbi:hypothetical protein [Rubinisphaera italica]|uniref:Uncharacterized protein n=1 Tax=Rubinisphaera italica TaxID=2527969 RepID=A0A5C5XMI6_9PLAN|nr:hypothetical protein [Rubinisphaera italica]TWT64416.1 hypothetical protein Pan54_51780 [Rubinisphaera italica]
MRVESIDDLYDLSVQHVAIYREHGEQLDSVSGVEGFCGLKLVADALYGVFGDEYGTAAGEIAEIVELPALEESYEFFIACIRPENGTPVQLSFSKHLEPHEVVKELVQLVKCGIPLDY